jgi:hypothetical protein
MCSVHHPPLPEPTVYQCAHGGWAIRPASPRHREWGQVFAAAYTTILLPRQRSRYSSRSKIWA